MCLPRHPSVAYLFLVRPRANLRCLLKVDRLRCCPPRPDPSRDGLDGFWPAGQTILCERRASNPRYGARRSRRRPCDATALPRDVRSGVLPGRTGQLLVVPLEGDFITRPDPDVAYMHGSPWEYDVSIPLMFAGPAVRTGRYRCGRAAGCCANTCGCAGRADAPDRNRPRIAGLADRFCSTASCHAGRPGWHAPGLLRPLRCVHANAHCPAPAQRLVHSCRG